jgi:hypothetical protein
VSAEGQGSALTGERLELRLDSFAAQALKVECERLSLSPQELAEFAIAYYLADLDSGRIARKLPRRPEEKGVP